MLHTKLAKGWIGGLDVSLAVGVGLSLNCNFFKLIIDVGCELFSELLVDASYLELEILLIDPTTLKQLLNYFDFFFLFLIGWLRLRGNLDLLAAFVVLLWRVLSMLFLENRHFDQVGGQLR